MADILGILIITFQSLFYLLLGGVIFLVGIFGLKKYRSFFKQAIAVTGKVIDYKSYKKRNRGNDMTIYCKVVGFELDGKMHEVTITSPASSEKPKIGTICKIWVNLDNLSEARIYSKTIVVVLWGLTILGALLTVQGIASFFQS